MAPTDKVKSAVPKTKKAKKPSNYDLGCGIMRYSRSQVYRRKAVYRLKSIKWTPVVKAKTAITVVKKIGGTKNGGERVVHLKKPKPYHPTKDRVRKRPARKYFSAHKRNTRPNLKAGRVLIMLAGRHAGKRVVLMKVLKSGLLLVNGPFCLNACPLRRVSQRYVICTQTRINVSKVKMPSHIDDRYFKRQQKKKATRTEGDIFAKKEEKYQPSQQRKDDQAAVDKMLKAAINENKDKKVLCKYLRSMFGLKSLQYPHRMKF